MNNLYEHFSLTRHPERKRVVVSSHAKTIGIEHIYGNIPANQTYGWQLDEHQSACSDPVFFASVKAYLHVKLIVDGVVCLSDSDEDDIDMAFECLMDSEESEPTDPLSPAGGAGGDVNEPPLKRPSRFAYNYQHIQSIVKAHHSNLQ